MSPLTNQKVAYKLLLFNKNFHIHKFYPEKSPELPGLLIAKHILKQK